MTATGGVDARRAPTWHYVVAGLALAALLGLGMFYLASGLVAPLWAVIALVAVWLGLIALGLVWFRAHPLRVIALPVIAAAVLVGAISAGGAWLGWTA